MKVRCIMYVWECGSRGNDQGEGHTPTKISGQVQRDDRTLDQVQGNVDGDGSSRCESRRGDRTNPDAKK